MFLLSINSLKKLLKLSCDQQKSHNSQSPLNILYVLKHWVLLIVVRINQNVFDKADISTNNE